MSVSPARGLAENLPPAALAELVGGLLREGTRVSIVVGGYSMAPFLRNGDRVTLEPVSQARLGEVVARLCGSERLLVHRVVGEAGPRPLTRGDSTSEADPAIRAGELLGRVERAERGGRRLRLGLGLESRPLALLSRWGWLRPLLVAARWLRRGVVGKT